MEKCIEFHKPDPTNRMGVVCCACLDLKRRIQMNILRKLVLETHGFYKAFVKEDEKETVSKCLRSCAETCIVGVNRRIVEQ